MGSIQSTNHDVVWLGRCRYLRHLGAAEERTIFSDVLRSSHRCFGMAGGRAQLPIPRGLFYLLAKWKRQTCLRSNRYQELAPKTHEVKVRGVESHTNKDFNQSFLV